MSHRKPIYILRMEKRAVVLTGRVTIEVAPGTTLERHREIVAAVVRDLNSIGIEATPKQPEAHR